MPKFHVFDVIETIHILNQHNAITCIINNYWLGGGGGWESVTKCKNNRLMGQLTL